MSGLEITFPLITSKLIGEKKLTATGAVSPMLSIIFKKWAERSAARKPASDQRAAKFSRILEMKERVNLFSLPACGNSRELPLLLRK
jgi:hypothetical protein